MKSLHPSTADLFPLLFAVFNPAVRYSRGSLQVLNQLKLPYETEYVDVLGADDAFKAIKTMMVRR